MMIKKSRINPAEVVVPRLHDMNRRFGILLLSRAVLRTGVGLLWFCLALPIAGLFATPAQAQTEIWSATLTIAGPLVEQGPEGYCSAACSSGGETDYGSVSVATFALNSTTYTVHSLRYGSGTISGSHNLRFQYSPRLTGDTIANLQLQIGSNHFNFSDATRISGRTGDDDGTDVLLTQIMWDLEDDGSERPWPEPSSGSTAVVKLVDTADAADQPEITDMPQQETGRHDPDGIHAELFPELSRTLSDLTGRALSERIDQAGSGTPDTLSLGGAAGLAEALLSRVSSLRNGTFDAAGFLSGSSFSLGSGERGRSTFWGSGSYRDLSDDTGPVHWDGAILGGHLGADTHLYPDVLSGLMVSVYDGDLDYVERREAGDVRGVYSLRLTSLNPYAAWRLASGARLWGTFGIGDGKVGLTAGESGAVHETALGQRSLTLGFRGPEQDWAG